MKRIYCITFCPQDSENGKCIRDYFIRDDDNSAIGSAIFNLYEFPRLRYGSYSLSYCGEFDEEAPATPIDLPRPTNEMFSDFDNFVLAPPSGENEGD